MGSRICWQNYAQLGGTILSASSSQGTRPVRWLRDQGRLKTWRSEIGWTVVAGWNDDIDLTEGITGDVVATIVAGTYATGAEMATAVQTALNAVATDNTYTVTYSTTTKKFTISRATGTSSFGLEWSTGASVATSAGKDLGYDVTADDTGNTSYTADISVYQSRHYIGLDLGAAREILVSHALEHNLGISSGSVTAQAHGSSILSALISPAATEILSAIGDKLRTVYFTVSRTYRYWALIIDGRHVTDGYTELGVPYLGSYWESARSIIAGLRKSRKELSLVTYADQGSLHGDRKRRARGWIFQIHALPNSNITELETALDYLGISRTFFFTRDPDSPEETLYGYFPTSPEVLHEEVAGQSVSLFWGISGNIEEAL